MKTIGYISLPEHFTWTTHQLLTMIKEVDKICHEEGMPVSQPNNFNPQTPDNDSGTRHE
jgi:hypothetical protein